MQGVKLAVLDHIDRDKALATPKSLALEVLGLLATTVQA